MKILVTVGSGTFDQLISAVDAQLISPDHQVTCQVGKGGQKSANHQWYSFKSDFKREWQNADLVICHCGAATVFELLEAGKKMVVVPNTFRVDKHQTDLAGFLADENYATVCSDLSQLSYCVEKCWTSRFKPYHKEPFFMAPALLDYFGIPNQ